MTRNDGNHRGFSLPSRPTSMKDISRDSLSFTSTVSSISSKSMASRGSKSKRKLMKVCNRMRSVMCLEPGSSDRQAPIFSQSREPQESWGRMTDTARIPEPAITESADAVEVDRIVMGSFLQESHQITAQIKIADEQFTSGEFDKAIRSYRSALRLISTSQNVHLPFNGSSSDDTFSTNRSGFAKRYIASRTLIKIGIIHHQRGRCDNALNSLKKALELAQTVRDLGVQERADRVNPESLVNDYFIKACSLYADVLKEHAVIHLSEQEFDRALERHEEEVMVRREALEYATKGDTTGAGHPQLVELKLSVANALINVGRTNEKWGKYQDSIEAYDEALKLRREVHPDPFHGSCRAELLDVLFNLGNVYAEMGGRYDISLRYFLELNRLLRKKIGSRHADVGAALTGIGKAYLHLGKYDKSLKALTGARRILASTQEWGKRTENERTVLIGDMLSSLGMVHLKTTQIEEAMDTLSEALELQKSVLDPQEPSLARTMNRLGTAYLMKGDFTVSLQLHRDALRIFKNTPSKETFILDAAYSHTYIGLANKSAENIRGAMQHFKAAKRKYMKAGVSSDHEELQIALKYLSDFEFLCAKATLMNQGLENDYDSLVSSDSASLSSTSRFRL